MACVMCVCDCIVERTLICILSMRIAVQPFSGMAAGLVDVTASYGLPYTPLLCILYHANASPIEGRQEIVRNRLTTRGYVLYGPPPTYHI